MSPLRLVEPLEYLDDLQYYDTGHTIGELRTAVKPCRLVFGDGNGITPSIMNSKGRVDLDLFSQFVVDFFKYLVVARDVSRWKHSLFRKFNSDYQGGGFFFRDDVESIQIPAKGSVDYVNNGDIYIRRASPFELVDEWSNIELDTGDLRRYVVFSEQIGHIPSSIAEAVCEGVDLYKSMEKNMDRLDEFRRSQT